MANANKYDKKTKVINNKHFKPQIIIKCYQINLQHSKTATYNLMELIEKDEIDVVFIQEPYAIHNRVVEITKRYRTFTSTIVRIRTATVITNKQIDALLIREATNKDTVVVEITLGNLKFYKVNMYLDITEKLDKNIEQINDILQLTNTRGLLITMDSYQDQGHGMTNLPMVEARNKKNS